MEQDQTHRQAEVEEDSGWMNVCNHSRGMAGWMGTDGMEERRHGRAVNVSGLR